MDIISISEDQSITREKPEWIRIYNWDEYDTEGSDQGLQNLQPENLHHTTSQQTHLEIQSATKLFFSFLYQMVKDYEKIHHDGYLIFDLSEQLILLRFKMHEHRNVYELLAMEIKLDDF